jgi:hypothetical protein
VAQRQFNIRIEEGDFEVLDVGAFVEGENPPDLARGALKALVAELEADPEVMEILRVRRARNKSKERARGQQVSSLDAKRNRRESK